MVQQDDTEVLVEDETVKAIHLNSCANSLFERLILTERAAGRTDLLVTLHKQGRMHPDIADFANRKFLCTRTTRLCTISASVGADIDL